MLSSVGPEASQLFGQASNRGSLITSITCSVIQIIATPQLVCFYSQVCIHPYKHSTVYLRIPLLT